MNDRTPHHRAARAPARRGGAFSLMEMVVAVGAFAVIAVSLAAIFNSVGDTISAGRRQSRLNQLAAQIERVMRADFERMTRDGFLVIVHEWAINDPTKTTDTDSDGLPEGLDVSLFPADPNARPRRVDQIMFFARGDFETVRQPVAPGVVARAGEARLWYGHGQLKHPDGDSDFDAAGETTYEHPRLDDTMQGFTLQDAEAGGDRLGFHPPTVGEFNPNEYAADWTLLRHVTLLCQPNDPWAQSLPGFGDDGLYGIPIDRNRIAGDDARLLATDADFQVALQPALAEIFWNAQELDPTIVTADADGYVHAFDPARNPPDRRVLTLAYDADPDGPFTEIARTRSTSGIVDIATTNLAQIKAIVTRADFDLHDMSTPVLSFEDFERELAALPPGSTAARERAWAWMVNALPTPPEEGPFSDDDNGIDPEARTGARVRYERSPTNLSAGVGATDDRERLRGAYEQIDQEVLTRWAFLPRCTEFIVEWSYGDVYDNTPGRPPQFSAAPGDPFYKQLIWFGRDRRTMDTDGDGKIDQTDRLTVHDYPEPLPPGFSGPQRTLLTGTTMAIPADPWLPERFAFGYFDPANPAQPAPWPWPKLIRLTMSIADPGDPSIETTVEVVIEVPDNRG